MATVSRIIEFTPTIGENDKAPEEVMFKVELRAVDVKKKQGQLRKFVEMKPKDLMKEMMSENHSNQVRTMLNEHFIGFINMFFKDVATKADVEAGLKAWPMDATTGKREDEQRLITEGERYFRLMTIEDMFAIGEFELAMEIFMHMIGSSQLKKNQPKKDDDGNLVPPTAGEDQEDEEKNSESPSGSTPIH